MNSKAPVSGNRAPADATNGRVAPARDREEEGSSSLLTGPQSRRSGSESHALLAGDLHEVLGNSVVRAALAGMETGPGAILESALTLGAAGMQVADSTAGLFSNRFMQQQLAADSAADTPANTAAAASFLSRRGASEEFSEEAGKRVDVALKRGGQPLPDDLRAKMEAAFGGADFSRVRIHTDGAATAAARGIRAHAFAVGENVYFGTGEFRPHSREGQELLAHELTHVVQAQEGRIRAGDSSGGQAGDVAVSSPTDSHEREAEAMATQVVGALGAVSTESVDLDSAGIDAAEQSAQEGQGAAAQAAVASEGVLSRSADACVPRGQVNLDELAAVSDLYSARLDHLLTTQAALAAAGRQQNEAIWQGASTVGVTVLGMMGSAGLSAAASGMAVGAAAGTAAAVAPIALVILGGMAIWGAASLINNAIDNSQGTDSGQAGPDAASALLGAERLTSGVIGGAANQAGQSGVASAASGFSHLLGAVTALNHAADARAEYLEAAATEEAIAGRSFAELRELWGNDDHSLSSVQQLLEQELGFVRSVIEYLLNEATALQELHSTGSMSRDAKGPIARNATAAVPNSTGQALPSQAAAALGGQLGSAVNQVRVHDGAEAAQFAQALNAKAVTVGQDIYFNRGFYRPGTTSGDELIAHEAHHAVIGGGRPGVSQPGDAHEREAVAFGKEFIASGGTQALSRMGLEAPTEALSSQINDRLAAVPRGGPDAATVDAELATGAIAPVEADLSSMGAGSASSVAPAPAASFDVPSIEVDVAPAIESSSFTESSIGLDITPVDAAMGSSESLSRDVLTGTAQGASDTTSGTQETQAETHAELTIAGKVYRVKVPPSGGQTATANTDLDAHPCEGLHLTGATINIDAEGTVVGGTVRGKLTVAGLFKDTDVAMGILPGGAIAPAVEGLPVKLGPATGTVDLSITEAGLSGRGVAKAAELGLPEWIGLRGGDLEFGFAAGEVTGEGTLTGTTTAIGTATVNSKLANQTLTSEIVYTLNPGLSPTPGVTIHNGRLSGTLVTPLTAGEGGEGGGEGGGAGPSVDSPAMAAPESPSQAGAGPSGAGPAAAGGEAAPSGGSGAQAAMQQGMASAMGSSDSATASADAGGGTETASAPGADGGLAQDAGGAGAGGGDAGGATQGGGAARDPNAFMLRGTGRVSLRDWVTGDVQIAMDPAGATYDLSGTLSAAKEMQFGNLLAVKSEVGLRVEQNVATESTAKVTFKGPKYEGEINGLYDIQGHKLNGDAMVKLTHHWPIEGEWGEIRMLRHGKLEATVTDNEIGDATGRVRFDGLLNGGANGPLDFEGHLEGKFDAEKEHFEGVAQGQTVADFVFPSSEGGAADQFTLLTGSTLRGEVTGSTLSAVKMDAALQYAREGEAFLEGRVADAVYDLGDGTISGKGTMTLCKHLERSTTDGKWTVRVLKGTNVDATVTKSALKEIGGDITIQVDDDKGKLGQGKLSGAKIDMNTWETSGKLAITTARKFHHPGEGQLMANGYGLAIMPGTGIHAVMKRDELTEVGGTFKMMVLDQEGSLARMVLQASLDLKTDEVDGKGSVALARGFTVAEDLGGQGWSAKILRGTKGEGHVEKGEFTKVSGAFKSQVDDEQGQFLRVDGTGEWTTNDQMFSVDGQITVKREKVLAEGGEGGWSLALLPGDSAASATIDKNVFTGIEGTVNTMVRKAGADFASVKLGGSWKESEGFKGEGEANLLMDHDVATIGSYQLSVVKGSGARIAVQSDDIDKIGGKVPMRLDDAGNKFIEGKVEGEYKIEEKQLDGTGSAQVLIEKHLGTLGSDQLWLIPSSSAEVTIKENALTEVGGEMNLSVRNGEGEYAKIALEGSFDAAGGTGFTGKGGVTVVRDNQLFAVDAYSFWLKQGGGATAHINQNTLEKIDGQVPFMVKDGSPAPLIQGSVNGTYDPNTGQITGTGAVYLGRTLDYDLGGGVQLKLLEGSGGNADVKESRLERLGGVLKAEIWKDGNGVVRVEANGEYNVVTNTLTRLSGTATLLKPLELLGGAVEVSNVQGTATIENNELVEAGGRGDLVIHPLNDMQGWFEVNWSTRGGNETYDGTGNVEFTLFDRDPQTGRGMGGEVGVTAKSDGTFTAVGEIDYDINEMLGGKLQVAVDQTWNPKVYGTMELDTNLVEARDLFKMERDIVPEQTVRLPYGLALFFGMRGGMGLGLDALRLQSAITVGNWHPMQDGSVPQFQSNLDLSWGMNFQAKVVPYLGLGGDIGFASAQMGARGEVELNAPVTATAGGEIKGQGGGFYGELSVGVGIAPTIDLAIVPYIKGEIPKLFSFEEDLDRFEQPMGEVFKFEWGRKYGFGDTQYKQQAPITPMDVPAPAHKETKNEGKPSLGMGSGGGGQNTRGGPQLESGSEIAAGQSTGDGQMTEVMNTLNDVIAVIEGLGAAGELFGMLATALAALATFGPAGLIVHIVWGIFTGSLSWDKIKNAVTKVIQAISAAGRLLSKHFPGWWNSVVDVFNGEKPGLLDALFGADDRMREAVGRGDHRYAPYEMHVEMVNTMKGGWLSTDDANCCAKVFAVAAQRGWLHRLVSQCGGADEFIDGFSTGFDDSAIKSVFRRNGVRW